MKNTMGITMWFLVFSLFMSQPLFANVNTDDTNQDFSKTVDPPKQLAQHHRKSMPDKRHYASIIIGAVNWPNIGDIDPSQAGFNPQQFGKFKTWGYNIEIDYHYLATTWFGKDLWIGLDFGVFFNENKGELSVVVLPSGETISGEIDSRGMYITPNLKWFVWGQRGSPRLYLGAGIGYYSLDFTELYEFGEGDEIFEENTIGGYLSAGLRFPVSKGSPESAAVILESKVHFADFGELAPDTGDIKGPIYIFQLGITF
ncbi:MAG: hypothetical protein HKO79_10080 [Desulfobacterales bacterium]|nr:hypothetical protein [Desulfobacterales bacterium]